MPEWWTYGPEDFLLFSPRVYWRMFELHNEAVWPLQIVAVLLGATILVWTIRPWPGSDRVIWAVLSAAWVLVAFGFLWTRYATINWAAAYAVPLFAAEALLLAWFGTWRGDLHVAARSAVPSIVGLAIFLYALIGHPFAAILADRPLRAAEIVGIAPDPTAMATVGLLLLVTGRAVTWAILAVPLAWCIVSWATLRAMAAPEAWVPLTAAGIAIAARLLPNDAQRRSPA
jgi:hypothetical protein